MKDILYYALFILLVFMAINIFWPLIVLIIVVMIVFRLYMAYKTKKLMNELEDYQSQTTYQEPTSSSDYIDVEYVVKEEKEER